MATTSSLAALAPDVGSRLQDPAFTFSLLQFEVYSALAEAVSELLLIIGRPTQIFNLQIALQPNTCFQPMPPGMLSLTNVRTNNTILWKTSLRSLDYLQASWGPSWTSDRAPQPKRWAPLGLDKFIVHPAPLQPMYANVTGIAYPFTDTWPPTGAEQTGFHYEFDQALEMYATSYCRVKEVGNDYAEGQLLYQRFLEVAKRATAIEDRRDQLVWSGAFGAATAASQVTAR